MLLSPDAPITGRGSTWKGDNKYPIKPSQALCWKGESCGPL